MEERTHTWADVEAAWDDPAAHDGFLEACRTDGNLPFAAECYRRRLAEHPDDPVALKRQKQVVALAMMAINLETARREALRDDERPSGGGRLPLLLGFIGAALGGLAGQLVPATGPTALAGGLAKSLPFAIGGGLAGLILGLALRRRSAT